MAYGIVKFGKKGNKGNAQQENVLVGKTFSNQDQVGVTGTMENLQNVNVYCGAEGVKSLNVYEGNVAFGQLKIMSSPIHDKKGYCDTSTTFETHLLGLIPENIKKGVTIANKMEGTLDYDGMVSDRNNWMNIANSKKQFVSFSMDIENPGANSDVFRFTIPCNFGFMPSIVFCEIYFDVGNSSPYTRAILSNAYSFTLGAQHAPFEMGNATIENFSSTTIMLKLINNSSTSWVFIPKQKLNIGAIS